MRIGIMGNINSGKTTFLKKAVAKLQPNVVISDLSRAYTDWTDPIENKMKIFDGQLSLENRSKKFVTICEPTLADWYIQICAQGGMRYEAEKMTELITRYDRIYLMAKDLPFDDDGFRPRDLHERLKPVYKDVAGWDDDRIRVIR